MVTLESKEEILRELNSFEITDSAYRKYISETKNNKYLTKDEVLTKLYRNIKLSIKSKTKSNKYDNKYVYKYGSMRIIAYGNKIVHIANNKEIPRCWYKDKVAYNHLNEVLGIYY